MSEEHGLIMLGNGTTMNLDKVAQKHEEPHKLSANVICLNLKTCCDTEPEPKSRPETEATRGNHKSIKQAIASAMIGLSKRHTFGQVWVTNIIRHCTLSPG